MTSTVARPLRRLSGRVFAGDPRVWRWAALVAVPLVALISVHLIQPRDYNTGTDSVEVHGYVAVAQAREPVCVPGLLVPAGTARLRFKVMSTAQRRPALHLALQLGGRTIHSDLSPVVVRGSRVSSAVFSIPQLAARPSATPATACLTADGVVSLGGTALPSPPGIGPPTVGGVPISARIAVWYLPPRGARQSYVEAAGAILARASLFRPGWVGPWLYVLMFLGVLPALAYASVRCLALAAGGSRAAAGGHLAVRHRGRELRLLGIDLTSLPAARRDGPLRLHAVARRARTGTLARSGLFTAPVVDRRDACARSGGLLHRPPRGRLTAALARPAAARVLTAGRRSGAPRPMTAAATRRPRPTAPSTTQRSRRRTRRPGRRPSRS